MWQNAGIVDRSACISIAKTDTEAPSTIWRRKRTAQPNNVIERCETTRSSDVTEAIGAAPDAVRMQRVVSFYEKLPRGPAPEVKAKGLLGRYQAKHFGKNPTVKRT
ncbi:hypothetical protein SPBR_03352 [Sporothrix brasiliensis 5110]|uniref:Uncharacterized protein n=1 Tax=Sporothrix brasiliensis 5110 TaxID=1398154 RepID=A0A0C2IT78_9PEZI|nr:uncharacterized protein SPBR_03352 [Sporothrix brasiliensis 5110]KIH92261.1 hypothetical protein SPBR_03352 [Sporothrix brasiliensis 5110]